MDNPNKPNIFLFFLIILSVFFSSNQSHPQTNKSMLSSKFPISVLQQILISQKNWQPFPTWEERTSWQTLPGEVRQEIIFRGEKFLNYQWPSLSATVFLEFARTGDRANFQGLRNARRDALCSLVLAECVQGNGRFLDDIVNGVWVICEESYWGVPAHLSMQAQGFGLPDVSEPTVDLFAGETAALLAWTSYLLGSQLDEISPLIQQRIKLELDNRILKPCLERDDFWWMSFQPDVSINNWNPWVNSNWLTVALLKENDENKRLAAVEKIMRSLDKFIESYPDDGGCDEGPGYWNRAGASLFDCLELLYSATNGTTNIYDELLIKEIGRYIYRAHISDRHFINFADASAIVKLETDLAYRYGRRIGDAKLASFAAYLAEMQRDQGDIFWGSIGRQLAAIFNYVELGAAERAQPLLRDVWMEGNQVMAARSEAGSAKGLFVAAKGGHNAESHNHNDIGNFIVYLDGQPMIIDVGVETYTKKTFSERRYEIWTMQSAFHNLPTIEGVMQKDGREFAAKDVRYNFDDSFAQLRLDISGAYPPEAGVNQWIRTIRLNRGEEVIITDAFDLIQQTQDIQLTLMTVCQVDLDNSGQIHLKHESGVSLKILFDSAKLIPSLETISITDNSLKKVWGDRLKRILLRANSPAARDSWVMRIVP